MTNRRSKPYTRMTEAELRQAVEDLGSDNDAQSARIAELEAEVEDYGELIRLQHTRTVVADNLWRAAHPREGFTIPDLGNLVEWLMRRAADAEDRAAKI
jgi:hypothetical protein